MTLDAEKILKEVIERLVRFKVVPPAVLVRVTVEVMVEVLNKELEQLQRKPEAGSRFVVEYEEED